VKKALSTRGIITQYKSKDVKFSKSLFLNIPGVKAAMIVSTEGIPIASMLPQGIDEERIAAMTATLWFLSERAILEMRKGDFDQFYIKGSEGYLLGMQAGPNAILLVSTTKDVRLGLILLDCRRTCEKIAKII
jgi:predicted regulator of Ras-like GTPase activity (Roadblock/LC7/MglB family)